MGLLYRFRKPSEPVVVEPAAPPATQPSTHTKPSRELAVACRSDEEVRRISLSALGVRSILDEGVSLQGNLAAAGSLAIKGCLKGDLRLRGESALAVVFPGARIEGLVRARYVWLAGELQGRLECQRLLVLPGGVFRGEAVLETLEVKHGGDYLPASTSKQNFDWNA